jgi:hypothetical protein
VVEDLIVDDIVVEDCCSGDCCGGVCCGGGDALDTVYSKSRNRCQSEHSIIFKLTHICRLTSTIMASCIPDPAFASFPALHT